MKILGLAYYQSGPGRLFKGFIGANPGVLFVHFHILQKKTVEQDLNLGLNLALAWFLPAVDIIRLHDGDLHTVNWGEGQ